ncbi:hypothetical protein BC833DRAFT_602184 [Globomyces pollinis-pini]|nr:hypothetical protein BC833DRAFT_602184 [Globomyces pollinis-pini]
MIKSGILLTLDDNRSRAVVRQHLLGDPTDVLPQDINSLVDTSPEHRFQMRKKLYLPRSLKKVHVPKVTGDMFIFETKQSPNKSTMQQDFDSKTGVENHSGLVKQLAQNTHNSHFSLRIGEEDLKNDSSTKRDYGYHTYNNVATRYQHTPRFKGYSLLHLEDPAIDSNLKHHTKKPFVLGNRLDEREKWKKLTKKNHSMASISFGDDSNDWKSVTENALVPHQTILHRQQCEYETLEKTPSSVLDNPDLKLSPIQTVHQTEFILSDSLDRKSLIYDNKLSKKHLNGTHFTLGNDTEKHTQSEYLNSFRPVPNIKRNITKIENSNKFCIIPEDYDDRKTGSSCQQNDFKSTIPVSNDEQIQMIKKMSGHSSICLGLEDSKLDSLTMTQLDYLEPIKRGPEIVKEKYTYGGKIMGTIQPDMPYQSMIGTNESIHSETVHHSDYQPKCNPIGSLQKNFQLSKMLNQDFRRSHFDLECNPSDKIPNKCYSHEVFGNPKDNKCNQEQRCAGTGGIEMVNRTHDGFDVTINNTITRYPNYSDTYLTTIQSVYKGEKGELRKPYQKSVKNLVEDVLQPNKDLRELTTISRRTHVAPEVMKDKVIAV